VGRAYRVGPILPASKSGETPSASASRIAVSRETVRCLFASSSDITGCGTLARFASALWLRPAATRRYR